ncbi:MAG: glutathione S-transferase family protein [Deltaproteobacteria bacterium]|nr:glutathione S-transferase family protein [Deltaproteobacteria bacterium]
MRLFHHPLSSNARRAVMTALHLKAKVDLVEIDLVKPSDRALLQNLNPNSKVPVLDDDGFLLWESNAIMQYVADRTPGQTLFPTEARARADVTRWQFWSAQHFTPAIAIFNWQNFVKGMLGQGGPDPVELARGERELAQFASVLDGHLATRTWIVGKDLTLADLSIAAPLMAIGPAKIPMGKYTNVLAWFDRVRELDAWKKTSL